ncbi:MAG: ABC transporter permease [Longimicrobiales bacterium]
MISRPPRLAGIVVTSLVGRELASRILADLDEEWAEYIAVGRGRTWSFCWYWILAIRSVCAVWWGRTGLGSLGSATRMEPSRSQGVGWGLDRVADGAQMFGQAARSLARAPGLSASAISVTALGVAASAVVFSVSDEVLLRPMPYAQPDRVVAVHGVRAEDLGQLSSVSYPNVADAGRQARTLTGLVAGSWWRPAFTESGNTQVAWGLTVSWNYFSLLGVEPAVGRFFRHDEEGEGRAGVAVISHGLWIGRFGSDPDVIGRTVSVNKAPYEIVGVAPEGFEDPRGQGEGFAVEIWRTPWFDSADWYRSGRSWKAFGRLAPGVSLEAANEELAQIMAGLADVWPDENTGHSMRAVPVQEWITGDARTTIVVLAVSVALILLIACGNIANLLLARGLRRADELSVRIALGASGGHLLRATLTEAVILAVVGGLSGVLLAFVGLELAKSLAGGFVPRLAGVSMNGRVLGFAVGVSVLTGLIFGALPGLRSRRIGRGLRTATEQRRDARLRRSLVVAEFAFTVVLLFGAGLFVRTFDALYDVDVGVETQNVVAVDLHDAGWLELEPGAAEARWDRVLDRVSAIPEVASAGAIDIVPFADNRSCDGTARADLPPPAVGEGDCTEVRTILPGAFAALGIRVTEGRGPSNADRGSALPVAWISGSTRDLLWPNSESPLGGRVIVHSVEFTVVGVVTDVRHFGPGEPARPMLYLTAHQEPWNGIARGLSVVLRTRGNADGLLQKVQAAVESASPEIPVGELASMDELLAGRVVAPRFRMALAGGFALIAFAIAMVGLAGVLGFSVSRRQREIGVRLALGADPHKIRRMVLVEGLEMLIRGLVLGLFIAIPIGALLSRFLYEVRPWDPIALATVTALMVLGLVVASLPAAVRAARGSPAGALQLE